MTIEEYRKNFLIEIEDNSEKNLSDLTSEFFIKSCEILSDIQEFSDYTECYFEGLGRKKQLIKINGFAEEKLGELYDYIFFINDFNGDLEDKENLTKTRIDKLYNMMCNFVEFSLDGYLKSNTEESGEYYELICKINENRDNIRKFRFYILTDNFLSKRVKNLKKLPIQGKEVDLNIWDINRFFEIESSTKEKETIEIKFKEYNLKGIPCIKAVSCKNVKSDIDMLENNYCIGSITSSEKNNRFNISYDAYLAVIPGNILNELYIKYDARLLEGNVRSFLGTNLKINKGIKSTIINYPDMFFTYNNGIAATATEIEVENICGGPHITKIKDLQIINGGQTTASIASALINNKAIDISNLLVPMKITVLDHKYAEKIIPRISKYANTQNKVSAADFFSNHPFHIKIEEYSRKIGTPRLEGRQYTTYWFYERARGQHNQGKMKLKTGTRKYKDYDLKYPKNQVIKKVDLAKFVNLYRGKPNLVSKGSQANMKFFAEDVQKIWEKNSKNINEVYFRKVVSLGILYKQTDKIVKNSEWYREVKSYKANVVSYSISYIFFYIKNNFNEMELDFDYIWKNQNINKILEKNISILSQEIYKFITGPRLTANVTEWCKKELCWKKMQENLNFKFSEDFIDTLISKEILKSEEKTAKNDAAIEEESNSLANIMDKGYNYWDSILNWNDGKNFLVEKEIKLIKMARDIEILGKIPTDSQIKVIKKAEKRLLENGMPNYVENLERDNNERK